MSRVSLLCSFIAAVAVLTVLPAASRGEIRFKHHYIDRDFPGHSYGQTSLVDVDRDGDLDFITGGKDKDKHVFWFEYRGPDDWARHVLGDNQPSDVGGTAIDACTRTVSAP